MGIKGEKRPLSAKDLCKIIKVCSNSGLIRLSFNELELEFDGNAEKNVVPLKNKISTQDLDGQMVLPFESLKEHNEESQGPETSDEKRDLLVVDDPVAWEASMLEDRTYATDDNRRAE